MADALLRRLMILQRLPEYPRKTTSRQLLEALELEGIYCSMRTVQRDLDYLSASGLFGIGADTDSKPVGWYWMAGKKTGNFSFLDRSSAVAFALLEPMVSGHLPSSVTSKLGEYFQQADNFLQNDHGWTRRVFVARNELPPPREYENSALDTICDALDMNVCLSVDYGRYYKGIDLNFVHVDVLHPLALISSDDTVYLVHYKGNDRRASMVPVHHLRNIERLELPVCDEARTFDVKAYARRARLHRVLEEGVSYQFKVSIKTARYLKENPLSPDQEITQKSDGICEVSFVADDTGYLRRRLRNLEISI